jgi:light-regulated signal transduction histidine kinase (bacteriophytochrome)
VDSENGSKGVRIEVIDSGVGITPDDLGRIWEPFFTTKPEGKGTGLGLAITRRATEAHQGTISIASDSGKSTTVTIFLPAIHTPKAEPGRSNSSAWKGGINSKTVTPVALAKKVREVIDSNGNNGSTGLR